MHIGISAQHRCLIHSFNSPSMADVLPFPQRSIPPGCVIPVPIYDEIVSINTGCHKTVVVVKVRGVTIKCDLRK